MALKQQNVRLDEEFAKQIKKMCLDLDISFQDAVREALEAWLDKKMSDLREDK